ncbi:MAG TPA: ABC transporter permease, partial [Chloroflexota bacterium]|nr:ABC transporter permease [Chloroflexota bacterium]
DSVGRFGFVGHRLLQLIPVALGVTIITFFLIHLIPGDPVVQMLGNHYTPKAGAALRHSLGLDKPPWIQYLIFMGNLFHGNLGQSIFYQQSVTSLVFARVAPSLWLIAYSAVLAGLIAVPLAIVAALNRDGVLDQMIRATFLVTLSMPAFWLGVLLIYFLAVRVHIFPVTGFGSTPLDHLYYLFLPAVTIAVGFSAVLIRSLRNSILMVLEADYVDTARAKGLTRPRVFGRHVLRNAMMSTVTIFGINIAFLVGSIVIVENVFAIPGIGYLLVQSILQRDYSVVQGITLLIAVFIVGVNLLTDVIYALLDPRVAIE